jgi:hypothetical protein
MTFYRLIREGCAGCSVEITDADGRIHLQGGFQTAAEASEWVSQRLASAAARRAECTGETIEGTQAVAHR